MEKGMKWLTELYSKKTNCFYCLGTKNECGLGAYFPVKGTDQCTYHTVAVSDLRKREEGRDDITLLTMLEEYEIENAPNTKRNNNTRNSSHSESDLLLVR